MTDSKNRDRCNLDNQLSAQIWLVVSLILHLLLLLLQTLQAHLLMPYPSNSSSGSGSTAAASMAAANRVGHDPAAVDAAAGAVGSPGGVGPAAAHSHAECLRPCHEQSRDHGGSRDHRELHQAARTTVRAEDHEAQSRSRLEQLAGDGQDHQQVTAAAAAAESLSNDTGTPPGHA